MTCNSMFVVFVVGRGGIFAGGRPPKDGLVLWRECASGAEP
jgi:hypothetical protein